MEIKKKLTVTRREEERVQKTGKEEEGPSQRIRIRDLWTRIMWGGLNVGEGAGAGRGEQ